MKEGLEISAVLPCFEEAANLERVASGLCEALDGVAGAFELLVVVSAAARDGTPALARRLQGDLAGVRVIEQPADDPGYGRALALGIRAARHPWLLLTDGDGQFDHAELPRLVALATTHDVVLGYRARRRDSPARRAASWLYGVVATRAVGARGVRDVDCAFKLLRRDVLGDAPLTCRSGVVNAEILSRAFARRATVAEVAVSHRQRTAGTARFETRFVGLGAVPRPAAAWEIARETLGLAATRFVASFRGAR